MERKTEFVSCQDWGERLRLLWVRRLIRRPGFKIELKKFSGKSKPIELAKV